MTEYEAYDTLMSIASNVYELMFGYFSLIFGFLVMSHMAARKLSSQLVVVVIALYSLASLLIISNSYVLNTDLDSLYSYMIAQKQNGAHGLSWFGQNPLWVPKSMSILQILLGAGGYFGSIFFFLHRRKESPSG